jgi:hypothetical protein
MEEIGAFLKESLQSIFTVAGQVTNTGFWGFYAFTMFLISLQPQRPWVFEHPRCYFQALKIYWKVMLFRLFTWILEIPAIWHEIKSFNHRACSLLTFSAEKLPFHFIEKTVTYPRDQVLLLVFGPLRLKDLKAILFYRCLLFYICALH